MEPRRAATVDVPPLSSASCSGRSPSWGLSSASGFPDTLERLAIGSSVTTEPRRVRWACTPRILSESARICGEPGGSADQRRRDQRRMDQRNNPKQGK